jgi:hypothetical protein
MLLKIFSRVRKFHSGQTNLFLHDCDFLPKNKHIVYKSLPSSARQPIGTFTPENMNFSHRKKNMYTRICTNKHVIFKNGNADYLMDKFPYTTTVFFDNCHTNFISYNLYKYRFPKLKHFYCNSYISRYSAIHRFSKNSDYICYLTTPYYIDFIWNDENIKFIKEISNTKYNLFLGTFNQVEPRFINPKIEDNV